MVQGKEVSIPWEHKCQPWRQDTNVTEGMRQGIDTAVGLMFTDGTVREHQLLCFYFLKGVGDAVIS